MRPVLFLAAFLLAACDRNPAQQEVVVPPTIPPPPPQVGPIVPPRYRPWVRWISIGLRAGAVHHNASIGLSVNF